MTMPIILSFCEARKNERFLRCNFAYHVLDLSNNNLFDFTRIGQGTESEKYNRCLPPYA